jgi:hypothetical protein
VLFALALCVAPLVAFVWATPDWTAAGDPALMGIRALDVGTSRTPLVGQPSSGAFYVEGGRQIFHPGPWHFYLLAGPVRLFGSMGMALVSVLIVGACLLVSAWAVFRQLGASAAMIAAIALGAITFTTGASELINPISSRAAGYPLLCSSVLLWCVLIGDLRLLPLTTAVVSFTAQQHLSVGPAVAVLTVGALAGLVGELFVHGRWRAPRVRREFAWACGWSVLVGLVMWAPPLIDQLFGEGNLGRLVRYTGDRDHETLGITSAFRQVAHSLGMPPLLGQLDFSGRWILAEPSFFTWLSALVVVLVVTVLGIRWWSTNRRKSGLAIMVGIAAVAGLANGSSVPLGAHEELRPAFYHWAFVLAFFVCVVLGLGLVDLARSTRFRGRALAPLLTVVALAAIVLPSALNPLLERRTNTLRGVPALWRSNRFDSLSDAVAAHRDQLGAQTVLMGGAVWFAYREALALDLDRRGVDVRHSLDMRGFVDDDRLVDRATVTSGLVLQPFRLDNAAARRPGELLAVIHLRRGVDPSAAFAFGARGFRLYLLDRRQILAFGAARPGTLTPSTRAHGTSKPPSR